MTYAVEFDRSAYFAKLVTRYEHDLVFVKREDELRRLRNLLAQTIACHVNGKGIYSAYKLENLNMTSTNRLSMMSSHMPRVGDAKPWLTHQWLDDYNGFFGAVFNYPEDGHWYYKPVKKRLRNNSQGLREDKYVSYPRMDMCYAKRLRHMIEANRSRMLIANDPQAMYVASLTNNGITIHF